MIKRLQNKVAESRLSLPVTAAGALLLWLLGGIVERQLYVELTVFALSTYLMVEFNNSNALLRVYSRMVSCTFIVVTTMALPLFNSVAPLAVQLCMIMAYHILFKCYQDQRAAGLVFYAFAFIGLASIFFIQVLFLVPLLWILMGTKLMALSRRTFLSSVVGLITPYWFISSYLIFQGDPLAWSTHFTSIVSFTPWKEAVMTTDLHLMLIFAFLVITSITGMVHFLRNGYKDKIRTRMLYEMLIVMDMVITLFIVAQPQHAFMLMGIKTISTSVLAAHFITFTNTRITNVACCALFLSVIAITLYNLWTL